MDSKLEFFTIRAKCRESVMGIRHRRIVNRSCHEALERLGNTREGTFGDNELCLISCCAKPPDLFRKMSRGNVLVEVRLFQQEVTWRESREPRDSRQSCSSPNNQRVSSARSLLHLSDNPLKTPCKRQKTSRAL